MTAYNPPLSKAVVEIPKGLAARYEAAGWTPVKKAETKSAERKPAAKK